MVSGPPRVLTGEEIEEALRAVPAPHAVTDVAAQFSRVQILRVLRAELTGVEIVPQGIPELTRRIVAQFEKTRVKPGSMVGFAAAEAPGVRFQQDTLSAVHKAGNAGMRGAGGAVGRMMDLVSKQQSKAESPYDACNIFFTDIQTQHSIMHNKRADIVALNLTALLRTKDPYQIEYHAVMFEDGVLPPWYKIYSEIYGVPMPDLETRKEAKLLRLFLDVDKVTEYKVMVSEVRRALLSSNSRAARFFVSPMQVGVIDVWVIDEELHAYGMDLANDPDIDSFNYLFGFATKLNKCNVKGIPGIRDLQPEKIDIWALMTRGQSYTKMPDKGANVWHYNLSSSWQMKFDWKRPRELWQFMGITVVSYDETRAASWVVLDGGDKGPPHKIIEDALKADVKASNDWQKAAVGAGKIVVTRPVTPENAMYWCELWFAKTQGTNLREIIVREDVDPRFTISNRPFEVLELYGIIAARRILLEELYYAWDGGRDKPDFSVRHFSLLADFVCQTGIPRPVSNLSYQDKSALAKATFMRQFTAMVEPAIQGVQDPIADVAASIMVGSRARIGPKAFEYQSGVTEGITADEIKNRLRAGVRPSEEIDQFISAMSDPADPPLYTVGSEGQASAFAAAALQGDEAEEGGDAELSRQYEAAALPPGVDDEEDRPIDDMLIIDDEDIPEEAAEVAPKTRGRKPASVVMSPALASAISVMGGTLEQQQLRAPPPPACSAADIGSAGKGASKGRKLQFVDDR